MRDHETALWAAIAAFFGSLLTIELIDVLNPQKIIQFVAAFVVALITAGSVYAQKRYEDAKKYEELQKSGRVDERSDD